MDLIFKFWKPLLLTPTIIGGDEDTCNFKFDKKPREVSKESTARLKYHFYIELLDNTHFLEAFEIILRAYCSNKSRKF